ncbi:MAG: methyltransferase [Bacteroidota bacterium]
MFHFRQFNIAQDRTAMKVGTDSILLGAWVDAKKPQRILDIGIGTGILCLMMAQKFDTAKIEGVELDPDAYKQAKENIAFSPWSDRIQVFQQSIQDFRETKPYDLIISNPPYFSGDLEAKGNPRKNARQGEDLDLEVLVRQLGLFLAENGQAHIILPFDKLEALKGLLGKHKLSPHKLCTVYPRPEKAPYRFLMALGKEDKSLVEEEIVIQIGGANHYSEAYKKLTQEFYAHELP